MFTEILIYLIILYIFYRTCRDWVLSILILFASSSIVYEFYLEELAPLKIFLYLIFILVLLPITIHFQGLETQVKKDMFTIYWFTLLFVILIYPVSKCL